MVLGGPAAQPIAWFRVPAMRDGLSRLCVAMDGEGLYYNSTYTVDEAWAYLTVFSMTPEAEARLREVGAEVTETEARLMGVR